MYGGILVTRNYFFSKEQVAALYNLGKERGIPVDSMRFNEFVDYAYNHAYYIIEYSRNPSPLFASCHTSFNSECATLLFDGETLYW
jgi:hypothetical protein